MKPIDDSLIDTRTLFVTCGGDPVLLQTMIHSFQTHFEQASGWGALKGSDPQVAWAGIRIFSPCR